MNSRFLLFLFLFVNFSLMAQHPWPPEGVEGVDYHYNSTESPKPDGVNYRTYGLGEPYYVGEFEDGKPKANTDFVYYFAKPEGHVMTIHHITENSDIIEAANYYPNGVLMSEGKYNSKKKEGIWKFYSPEGILTEAVGYLEDELHGVSNIYDEKGKLVKMTNYTNGKKDGAWEEYFEDRSIRAVGIYKNGVLNGETIYYTSRGTYEIKGTYANGQMHGNWNKYTNNGDIEITTKYEYGKKLKERRVNGTFKDYWNDEIPKAEYIYEDGKKNGPFKEWHEMGEWTKVQMDDVGSSQGYDYKLVITGDQIQREGDYLDDKLEGDVMYYDTNGRLTKTETYLDGELTTVVER